MSAFSRYAAVYGRHRRIVLAPLDVSKKSRACESWSGTDLGRVDFGNWL